MIDEYKFGSITIDGKTYNHDVEVRPEGEVLSWQRKESHIIDASEVKRAIEQNPEVIIIGTGESGIAEVIEGAEKEIKSKGIELVVEKTGTATEIFNRNLDCKRKVIGLFHLTC